MGKKIEEMAKEDIQMASKEFRLFDTVEMQIALNYCSQKFK